MYESPIIIRVDNDENSRFCGDPAVHGICEAYCDPGPNFCIMVGVYHICQPAIWTSYCEPVTAYNWCAFTTFTP